MACHEEDQPEIRLVLLGKTGSGKSATGNTILNGDKKFTTGLGGTSVTRECHCYTGHIFKRRVHVVDTPGVFDTDIPHESIKKELSKCILLSAPGPHAFILVINVRNRFTKEEKEAVEKFVSHFDERIYKYFIVLFTGKDDLNKVAKSEEEYLNEIQDELREILNRCGNRCIFFNNFAPKEEKDQQVRRLLDMIDKNVAANNGSFYEDEIYQKGEQVVRRSMKDLKRKMQSKPISDADLRSTLREEVEKEVPGTMKNLLNYATSIGAVLLAAIFFFKK